MNPAGPFSNPFERDLRPLAAHSQPYAAQPAVDRGCIGRIEKLMQDVVAAYSQVMQAGPTVSGNVLYLKCAFQFTEFEVLKINLGAMARLSPQEKLQIVNAVANAWTTIASNSFASLQQMNTHIAALYTKIMSDHQGHSAPFTTLQLLYVMYVSEFQMQVSSIALDSLHRMRVDMLTAGNISKE